MTVTSVDRALLLLEVIAERPGSLTVLADRSGLPVTTISRLLETLEDRAGDRQDLNEVTCVSVPVGDETVSLVQYDAARRARAKVESTVKSAARAVAEGLGGQA